MSGGANKSNSQSQSQSQQTSQSYLSPEIMNLLTQNYGTAQNTVAQAKYNPLTGAEISSYENPYQSDVINATMGALGEQNQEQLAQNGLGQAASGAYDSTRAGVQNAETNRLYNQTAAQTLAQLENANYSQAAGIAQGENQNTNNWPLLLQQVLNQSLGLMGNPVLSNSQGTSSSSSRGSSFGFNFSLPQSSGGGS